MSQSVTTSEYETAVRGAEEAWSLWEVTVTSISSRLTELARQSGIESSLAKGEVAPGAAAKELLALYTLTTTTEQGLYAASFVPAATALYVNSKTTHPSQETLQGILKTLQQSWS